MSTKRKKALLSCMLATMMLAISLISVTVSASEASGIISSLPNSDIAANSAAVVPNDKAPSTLVVTDPDSEVPPPQPPITTSGGLEVISYTTTISGQPVVKITPGLTFELNLRVTDSRLANTTIHMDNTVANGAINTASFLPVAGYEVVRLPITQGDIEGAKNQNRGVDYSLNFMVTYTGKGNTFQCDIYYEGSTPNLPPMTSVTLTLNDCEETPSSSSSSSSDSSSQVVRGTGFALKEASYGAGSVLAGQRFQLDVTMLATNGSDSIENVSATLIPDKEFTLASGTSTVYFGTAAPGKSIPLTFDMKSASDAKDGSYKVTLKMQGVSSRTGENVETTVELSIPISQPDRLVINNFSPPDFISAGMDDGTGYTSVNIINMGKSDISNVMVEIMGDGIYTTEGSTYLGTFAPGTQNSADFTVMGDTPGQYEAEVVVSYENARGETNELREKFSIEVAEGQMIMPDSSFVEEIPQEAGMPMWGWLLIGFGVVLVFIIVILLVRKKRKRARDADLEDDDDAVI